MQKRVRQVYKTWSKDAKNRGDRKITMTAPGNRQSELYRECLSEALEGRKNPLVLNLGATPELRNLELAMGCGNVHTHMAVSAEMSFNLGICAQLCLKQLRRSD